MARRGLLYSPFVLVLTLVFAGVHQGRAQKADPELPPVGSSKQETQPESSTSPTTSPAASDYVIGPEDVLDIDVFNLPELTKTVRVANDGTISLALLGHLKAAGLSTQELRERLETKWGEKYLENPQVAVFVKEYHAQPVSVIGAVERAGVYQLTGPRTLIDILSTAGGLAKRTSDVPGRTVYVTRKGGFGELPPTEGMRLAAPDKVEINLRKLFYSNESALNIGIKPFDIVSVSKADIVYVTGRGVQKPGGFVLEDRESTTAMQALAMAEGLGPNAAKRYARIIRRQPDGTRLEIPVDLDKVLKGTSPDPVLAANDILFVPDSTQKAALKRAAEATVSTISGLLIFHR